MTDGNKKSFWTTLPGVLTAIAGILGSIAAILTILNPSTPPIEDLNPIIEDVKEKIENSSDSGGRDIVVDSIGGGDHLTISNAINAAEDGDTILIHPGIYREGLVIDKRLRILGDGDLGDVVIKATGESVLRFITPSAEVSNLVLKQEGGGYFYAIDIGLGTPTLKGCDITSKSRSCVAIYGEADPHIYGNIIHDGMAAGIFVSYEGLGTIEDNDIYGNAFSGIEISEGGNPTISNNKIHDGDSHGIYVYDDGLGTIKDNDIYGNALAGIWIKEGGNPTVTGNRINKNGYKAIVIYHGGAGIFKDNDLRDNDLGAWGISEDSKPLDLGGNVE